MKCKPSDAADPTARRICRERMRRERGRRADAADGDGDAAGDADGDGADAPGMRTPPSDPRRMSSLQRAVAAGGEAAAAAAHHAEPDTAASAGPEADSDAGEEPEAQDDEPSVEGTVELLANGSGFLRVTPPEPSDDDVYISAAQVKRCELVSGDVVAGPRRAPRRSERFASLVRIDTINGQPAAELISGARFEDLPAAFADERLRLDSLDPTIKAIEAQTPFGKGSRVVDHRRRARGQDRGAAAARGRARDP